MHLSCCFSSSQLLVESLNGVLVMGGTAVCFYWVCPHELSDRDLKPGSRSSRCPKRLCCQTQHWVSMLAPWVRKHKTFQMLYAQRSLQETPWLEFLKPEMSFAKMPQMENSILDLKWWVTVKCRHIENVVQIAFRLWYMNEFHIETWVLTLISKLQTPRGRDGSIGWALEGTCILLVLDAVCYRMNNSE